MGNSGGLIDSGPIYQLQNSMNYLPACLSAFATVALLVFPSSARSQTTAVAATLYNFIGNGTDGVQPHAGLVQGSDGNFYGTTASGGSLGYGTIFQITPAGVFTTLHSFTNGADGADPEAGLVQGGDGNFYGTTRSGGSSNDYGTVFRITPDGVLTTLHIFTQTGTDGSVPVARLVQSSDGRFYGTTYSGGSNDAGTLFSITASGEYATLYSFLGKGTDGEGPEAGLVQGSDGNFYGTTLRGGGSVSNGGTVFRITPAGDYTTLHSFTGIGLDGQSPHAGLIQGSDGNFYGTTVSGGKGDDINGTVFQITPSGVFHPLYDFDGTDGSQVYAGLVQGSDGNLYGTTQYGGSTNLGTAFQVTLAGEHTILHNFSNTGTDGGYPVAGLIQGSDGSFYGTTPGGGSSGQGTIFKLTFVPVVNIAAAGTGVIVEGGAKGVLIVTRTGDDSTALTVNYKVKGAAVAGVDYKTLPGTVTIPTGAAKAKIKVKPLIGSPNTGTLKIKVILTAPGDGSYAVGNGKAKIKLIGK